MTTQQKSSVDERFVTHLATIKDIQDDQVTVVDPTDAESEAIKVSLSEIRSLNQPHAFAEDILGNLVFEDGLKCNYTKTNTKLILYQIAFELAPLIEKLDFSAESPEI